MIDISASNEPVAENIKRIVQDKGLKQYAVAQKAGLAKREFNDILNGRRLIKASEIASIMNVLDVDANALFMTRKEREP